MKPLHQNVIVLLSCCLLASASLSAAQVRSFTDVNRTAQTATSVSESCAGEPKLELVTVPSGTHLIMKLISPLHTTSATRASGVYLETAFPVVAEDRVAIPEHTRVLGTVADERRPGRVKGRAQLRLKFTQLILPDNRELSIVGNLQSLPGSNKNRAVNNGGTIEPVDQIDADVYTVAKTTGLAALGGALSRHGPAGVGYGALIGGSLGLAKVLFTRGDEISLPVGTTVEMVLQRPLTLRTISPSPRVDPAADTARRPSDVRQQSANLPADNVRCLRDGRTLQCVP